MWRSIEEKILFYSELSAEERHAVEEHVAEHPELQPLLEEAQAFAALVGEAQLLRADPPGDEALAYFIATRHLSSHPLSAPLQDAFDRIEARLKEDSLLQARHAELVRRMRVLEATSDPIKQFEALSQHTIPPPQPVIEDHLPVPGKDKVTGGQPVPPLRKVWGGKKSMVYRLWGHVGRWSAAAVVLVLALYGSLGLVSHFSQSDLDRLAVLEPSELLADAVQMRGGEPVPDLVTSDELYTRASALLREARTHTLGLFPHYDQATLDEAANLFERIIDQEEVGSPLQGEAYYLLAKVRLARKNVESAKVALRAVVEGGGLRATEAQALLVELQRLSR